MYVLTKKTPIRVTPTNSMMYNDAVRTVRDVSRRGNLRIAAIKAAPALSRNTIVTASI